MHLFFLLLWGSVHYAIPRIQKHIETKHNFNTNILRKIHFVSGDQNLLWAMQIILSKHFLYLLKVSKRNPNARSKRSTMFKVDIKNTKTISLPKLTAIY